MLVRLLPSVLALPLEPTHLLISDFKVNEVLSTPLNQQHWC
jgi:hypothetical protein